MSIKISKWLKVLFITVALIYLASLIDLEQLVGLLTKISIPLFLVAVLIVTFDQAFMGVKWTFLLHIFHVNVPYRVPVMAYLKGRIFSFVAPSSLGIDAYKIYCVRQYCPKTSPILSSIVVERTFGLLSSIAIILIMLPLCIDVLPFDYKEYITLISVSGLLVLCLSLHLIQTYADIVLKLKFPVFFPNKAHELLDIFVKNLALVKEGRKQVWLYFILSIVEKTSYGAAVYFCSRSLGLEEPGLLLMIGVAPIVALLERLPISVSGIGIREGLFVLLFAPFYDDPTVPLAVSLVLRLAEMVQMVVFMLTWFTGGNKKVIQSEIRSIEENVQ